MSKCKLTDTEYIDVMHHLYRNNAKDKFYKWLDNKGIVFDFNKNTWLDNGNKITWDDIVINNWEEFIND